jgi:O-antigen/teichoic acid export membrane protein
MNSSNKIFANTLILYGRMLLSVGITLFTTRLVLEGLGVTDYGIYNLVAGVIFMLSFLNSAMTTSTQRFLSFYLGKKNESLLRTVFSNSLKLHIIIGLIVIVILEIVGFFLFKGILNIPANRLSAAEFIYHLMSLTVFFTITAVPFNALLIAHENMLMVSVGNLLQSALQMFAALLLVHYSGDRLKFYGLSTELTSVVIFATFWIICHLKYKECRAFLKQKVDRKLTKEIASNVSWNLLGVLSGIAKNQGMAVVFNIFDGPVINAAYAIASQVAGQLNFLSGAMLRSINPQIMKSEGEGNRARVLKLSFIACKLGFFLLAVVAIPILFYMPEILKIWLKHVPPYAVSFCCWVVIAFMANQLTMGMDSAVQAIGKIRFYMITISICKLSLIPIAIILLHFKQNVNIVLIIYCVTEFLGSLMRIYISGKLFDVPAFYLFKSIIAPLILSGAIAVGLIYLWNIPFAKLYFPVNMTLYASIYMLVFAFIGLSREERESFYNKIAPIIKYRICRVNFQKS